MGTIWILLGLLALCVAYYNRDVFIKEEVKVEPKVYEPTFILENEKPCDLATIVDHSVNYVIADCKQFHFYWIDKTNIWTESIFTFQLQCRLEKMVAKYFKGMTEEDGKEMVREVIKMFHLRTIEKYPELKEY